MNELQRHRLVFKILLPAIKVFTKLKFNYEYDNLSKIESPYLLLPTTIWSWIRSSSERRPTGICISWQASTLRGRVWEP